jgi:hypothetical protein
MSRERPQIFISYRRDDDAGLAVHTLAGYRENVSTFVDTPWKIVFRFIERLLSLPKKLFPWGPTHPD